MEKPLGDVLDIATNDEILCKCESRADGILRMYEIKKEGDRSNVGVCKEFTSIVDRRKITLENTCVDGEISFENYRSVVYQEWLKLSIKEITKRIVKKYGKEVEKRLMFQCDQYEMTPIRKQDDKGHYLVLYIIGRVGVSVIKKDGTWKRLKGINSVGVITI